MSSNYDIAIGVDDTTINTAIAALYNNSTTREEYFKGSYSKDVSGQGEAKLTYDILQAPTVTLAPPSQDDWSAAIQKDSTSSDASSPTPPIPADCFQVHFPSISGSESIDDGTPIDAKGELYVYLAAGLNDNVLSLDPVAVWFDTSGFSAWDAWFIPTVVVPAALQMASTILDKIKLPALPSYQSVSFNAPILSITNQQLVLATTLTTTKDAASLDGFSTPDQSYYALISSDAITAVANAGAKSMLNVPQTGSEKTGDDATAWAKGSYSVSLKSFSATADTTDPTKVSVSISADISVSGSAGGAIVAACALSTAALTF